GGDVIRPHLPSPRQGSQAGQGFEQRPAGDRRRDRAGQAQQGGEGGPRALRRPPPGRSARRALELTMAQQSVYVISVAAELAGVHPQTLRIYERKGLLEPKRTAGNTRRYSDDDIARLRRIQQLTQQQGVNLAGVRIVMELEKRLREM